MIGGLAGVAKPDSALGFGLKQQLDIDRDAAHAALKAMVNVLRGDDAVEFLRDDAPVEGLRLRR